MKFLVTGLGSIGQRHVRNIRTLLGDIAEITAYRSQGRSLIISDTMTAEAGSPEQEYGIRLVDDLETALAEHPDVVLVTNPTSLHVSTALMAAENGCNLFIEKPLSDSLEETAQLAEVVDEKNLVAQVGLQLRFHPALREIRRVLAEGTIGRVVSASLQFGEYLPNAHPYEDYRAGYAARKELGGGAVLSLIHEIDYACWLFGKPSRVFAMGGSLSGLGMDVEDTSSILMECNVAGTAVPVRIHLDFVMRPPTRGLQIVGDQGTLSWNYYENGVRVFTAQSGSWKTIEIEVFGRNQLFLDEMRHFLRCLKGDAEPIVSIKDAIDTLDVALKIKQSMATGSVVEV